MAQGGLSGTAELPARSFSRTSLKTLVCWGAGALRLSCPSLERARQPVRASMSTVQTWHARGSEACDNLTLKGTKTAISPRSVDGCFIDAPCQPKVQILCHGRRHLGQSLRARASWQARDLLLAPPPLTCDFVFQSLWDRVAVCGQVRRRKPLSLQARFEFRRSSSSVLLTLPHFPHRAQCLSAFSQAAQECRPPSLVHRFWCFRAFPCSVASSASSLSFPQKPGQTPCELGPAPRPEPCEIEFGLGLIV